MAAASGMDNDPIVDEIRGMLSCYTHDHPGALADAYRYNSASVRIKIEDSRFAGLSKGDRHDTVWDDYISHLTSETISDISMLILVTPGERHVLDLEFSEPTRSFS